MAPNWMLVTAVPARYLDGRDMIVVQMPGGRQLVAHWESTPVAGWITPFGPVLPTHVLPLDALPVWPTPEPAPAPKVDPEPTPEPAPLPTATPRPLKKTY